MLCKLKLNQNWLMPRQIRNFFKTSQTTVNTVFQHQPKLSGASSTFLISMRASMIIINFSFRWLLPINSIFLIYWSLQCVCRSSRKWIIRGRTINSSSFWKHVGISRWSVVGTIKADDFWDEIRFFKSWTGVMNQHST